MPNDSTPNKVITLPLLPLPRSIVLFPTLAARIPLSQRPDLAALLTHLSTTSPSNPTNWLIGAIPLNPTKSLNLSLPETKKEHLFTHGTTARIIAMQNRIGSEFHLIIEGIQRFRLLGVEKEGAFLEGKVELLVEEPQANGDMIMELRQKSREVVGLWRPRVLQEVVARREDAGKLADLLATVGGLENGELLKVLATLEVKERVDFVLEAVGKKTAAAAGERRVVQRVRGEGKRGFTPRMPGEEDEMDDLNELRKRVEKAELSAEARKVAEREVKRLSKMSTAQAEYHVCRAYVENLVEIPWVKETGGRFDSGTLKRAKEQLDEDHYGLEKIKKRLVEYLAVLKLKSGVNAELEKKVEKAENEDVAGELRRKRMVDKSPILLLVGPPGTGKTSLAKSVAASLGREFHRISLGGVRDEGEIRGHRRTYVAAMPGLIVTGLKKVGVVNPVFLLDEIDKIGMGNHQGDPSAAMLEVLDPEQNHTFVDHYVSIPIDLSKVLFIATANSLDTIPPPLLDRMETIQLSGYTSIEKQQIARRHLLPKQVTTNGLNEGDVKMSDAVLEKIITAYTREAGVRNLERELGSVCRAKAVQYADAQDSSQPSNYNPVVEPQDLEPILGAEKFEDELASRLNPPGIVTGLVAFSSLSQGSILFIEVAEMPGNGQVQLTGTLGGVLQESVHVALSWVKAHAFELSLTTSPDEDIMKSRNIHVHCPAGAIPKDGPSAGLAHTVAIISLFSGRPVPPKLAMTGEISLRGRVLPVGGITEKCIGAMRAGVEKVLLPEMNRKDVKELPLEVRQGLEIAFVGNVWDALGHVWPDRAWEGHMDSRL
ncbi:ATP-dependent protease La [Piedraia hortae CBS 480.64]|uniref:Lon protease homolog n=1 Tax=Piedraia hortae CBS 480.64 TaxID=1314780 RepID=A0A6A7C127_9PEZI|nr:ATP-dependent protease La [Piedraia hortae CBS 480.64]